MTRLHVHSAAPAWREKMRARDLEIEACAVGCVLSCVRSRPHMHHCPGTKPFVLTRIPPRAPSPSSPPPPPPSPPTPPPTSVCSLQNDGTCKSILNIRCADWRDEADTWALYKQKDYIEKCMAQDCEQVHCCTLFPPCAHVSARCEQKQTSHDCG